MTVLPFPQRQRPMSVAESEAKRRPLPACERCRMAEATTGQALVLLDLAMQIVKRVNPNHPFVVDVELFLEGGGHSA